VRTDPPHPLYSGGSSSGPEVAAHFPGAGDREKKGGGGDQRCSTTPMIILIKRQELDLERFSCVYFYEKKEKYYCIALTTTMIGFFILMIILKHSQRSCRRVETIYYAMSVIKEKTVKVKMANAYPLLFKHLFIIISCSIFISFTSSIFSGDMKAFLLF
jgi:hypothetical protein